MKITWHGHACFQVESAGGSVVFDPFAPNSVPGVELGEIRADEVICSHSHADHNFAEAVNLTGIIPKFEIKSFSTWHDDQNGTLRGPNKIAVFEDEGIKVVHMGDIGHVLPDSLAAEIGPVDILMIPVGGFYTVDADTAKRISTQLSAKIILPMHYRSGKMGYDCIGTIDYFTGLFEPCEIQTLSTNFADVKELHGKVAVFTLKSAEGKKHG